jgi:hypothetical protein
VRRFALSLAFLFFLILAFPAWATTHTWINNGGNWSDTSHWSPASVPTSADNVVFNSSSFSSGSQNVVLDAASYCLDMDWTGVANAPTITKSGSGQLVVSGSLTLATGVVWAATFETYFVATSSKTITTNGIAIHGNIYFQGIGGSWVFQDNVTGDLFTLTAGTLNTNGKTVTASVAFAASYSPNARTLTLGASTLAITGYFFVHSGVTFSGASSTINVSGSFSGGGKTYGTVNLTGTGASTISDSSTFSTLATTTQPKTISFTVGTTQTVTNFNVSGTAGNLITLRQVGASGTWTLSKPSGIIVRDYLAIQNSIAAGGATWYAGTHSTDSGGNTGWIFSGPTVRYWVADSGVWSDATNHWALTSGGAPGVGNIPTSTTDALFDVNSFTGAGKIVTLDTAGAVKTMTWTGATSSPTFTAGSGSSLTIYGTLTYISAMSTSGNFSLNFYGNASSGMTTTGHALYSAVFGDGTSTGTWTLYDSLTTSTITTAGSATLNTNGQAVTLSGALTAGASTSLTFGASTITAGGFAFGSSTVSAASTSLICANSAGCSLTTSGSLVAAVVTFSGATGVGNPYVLSGTNTIGTLSVSGDNVYLNVTAGTTQTLGSGGLVTNATAGNLTYLQSTSPGTAWNLSKPFGTVSVLRTYLKDSHASGGAQWAAGLGSIDAGGNTGWQFPGANAPFFGSVF